MVLVAHVHVRTDPRTHPQIGIHTRRYYGVFIGAWLAKDFRAVPIASYADHSVPKATNPWERDSDRLLSPWVVVPRPPTQGGTVGAIGRP